jgi:hypothetical protein
MKVQNKNEKESNNRSSYPPLPLLQLLESTPFEPKSRTLLLNIRLKEMENDISTKLSEFANVGENQKSTCGAASLVYKNVAITSQAQLNADPTFISSGFRSARSLDRRSTPQFRSDSPEIRHTVPTVSFGSGELHEGLLVG